MIDVEMITTWCSGEGSRLAGGSLVLMMALRAWGVVRVMVA